jgi:predicted ATPase/DNA-binding XRE family transcriptional regulator
MFDDAQAGFGPLLRRLRMAAGLSQEALAERARISTEAVGSLERGSRRAPQRQTLALLIDALQVDGVDRERLVEAAVRPSLPRRRRLPSSLAGIASPLRIPAPLTSFVGRENDLVELLATLEDARLISLVGPGGVGKSRLALEVARRSSERFKDGAVLVELAPVASGASVISAFAAALGVSDEGNVAVADRVVAACRTHEQLVVVDNCEHVLYEAAAVVYALLGHCPNLRIVATSREPLRVTGERIFRLGPLSPDRALELFVERAKAVAPYLQFQGRDLDVAGLICRRVDGIPLAIELAASRCDMLDLATILERLQARLELLSAHLRTALPYHRTLRALVDWSHELLDPDEALVFRRLAAFAGGCRLDDAEAILAFDGVEPDRVLEVLARLHDKSLLDVDRADPPRFAMLQTIADYAHQQLAASDEASQLEARYASYYLELAIGTAPALRGAAQSEAIARLSAEVDNVRAALALSARDPALREIGLHALGALSFYWIRTGALTEASTFIESLAGYESEAPAGVAWAGVAGAFIELNRQRHAEARTYAVSAVEAAQRCGDEWLSIYAAIADCSTRVKLGEDPRAAIAAAYHRADRLGDPWLIAAAAFERGAAETIGNDVGEAARYFAEALDRSRATGDRFMVCASALNLGRVLADNEPVRAVHLIATAIEQLAPGAALARATCIESLVTVALNLGRADDAARLLVLACGQRIEAGDVPKRALIEIVRQARGDAASDDHLYERKGAPLDEVSDAVRSFIAAIG